MFCHSNSNTRHCPLCVMLAGVFICHLCLRPFEWEQWVLFHELFFKDKREAWKEEMRPVASQTQQEQCGSLSSHFSPSQTTFTGKASVAPGWSKQRNSVGFTIHKQVPELWSCWGKWRIKFKQGPPSPFQVISTGHARSKNDLVADISGHAMTVENTVVHVTKTSRKSWNSECSGGLKVRNEDWVVLSLVWEGGQVKCAALILPHHLWGL